MKTKTKGIMAVFLSVLMLIMLCPATLLRADAADYYEVEIWTYDLLYVTITNGGNVIKIEPSANVNYETPKILVKLGDSIKVESTAIEGVVNAGWKWETDEDGVRLVTTKKDFTFTPESDGSLFFSNYYIDGSETYSGTCKDINFGNPKP